jgi:hypothetical protein
MGLNNSNRTLRIPSVKKAYNKALVRMQTTLRFVCTAQLCHYVLEILSIKIYV